MAIKTSLIMRKDCVTIVIINMEETKNLGIAHMINFTLEECVKTATLTSTIRKKDRKSQALMKRNNSLMKLRKKLW